MDRRALLLVTVAVAIVLFFSFGFDQFLSLHWVKMRRDDLSALYTADPAAFIASFIAMQAAALALCIPGAMVIPALTAGAIFGIPTGAIVVLSAVPIGDSLGFLAARYLFRSWAERWLDRQMERVDREVAGSGVFYLLSLRLFPVVPFFAVNVSLGLTRMPLLLFAPVSFVGLIPATFLYVNAGRELSAIQRPADIYSPTVIASFGLLALVPLALRFTLHRTRK